MPLTDLPPEILCSVVYYVLPDLTDMKWSMDPRAADKLFVEPILRVCQVLRSQAHNVINTCYIWVSPKHIQIGQDALTLEIGNAPTVSPGFYGYIRHASTLDLELIPSSSTPSEPFVCLSTQPIPPPAFPLNFDILLRLWAKFHTYSARPSLDNIVQVRYQNLFRRLQPLVNDLVAPALTFMSISHHLPVHYQGRIINPSLLSLQPGLRYRTRERLHVWRREAETVVLRVITLAENGYYDEAGLLLINTEASSGEMDVSLLNLRHYRSRVVEVNSKEFTIRESTKRPLHVINQLRKLSWYIRQGATISSALFYGRYGDKWTSGHEPLINTTAFDLSAFGLLDWFGATKSELAQMHLRRAVQMHMLYQMEQKRRLSQMTDGMDPVRIDPVSPLTEIITASRLDPENQCIHKLKDKFSRLFGEKVTATAEAMVDKNLTTETCDAYQINGTKAQVSWEGDSRVFSLWGYTSLRYHFLAQEGVYVPVDFVAWLEKMTLAYVDELTVDTQL